MCSKAALVVFSALLALALAGPAVQQLQPQQQVLIRSQEQDLLPDGSYRWGYESEDGSSQQAVGQQVQVGQELGQSVAGSAGWIDPTGVAHQLQYVADENGYRPQSADLPVRPDIPAAILRALEWNEAHPEPENQKQ